MDANRTVAALPSQPPKGPDPAERDEAYELFAQQIRTALAQVQVVNGVTPLFTTTVAPEALWQAYLAGLPADRRQHYHCHACRRFVENYGGLAFIEGSVHLPLFWHRSVPPFFQRAAANCWDLVATAKLRGVFIDSTPHWGTPTTGPWHHLSCPSPFTADPTQSDAKRAGDKLTEYHMVWQGLTQYKRETCQQAVRLLEHPELLYRPEKVLPNARWLVQLHEQLLELKEQRSRQEAWVWYTVATAPAGWTHFRSGVLGTLLDDLQQGLGVDLIKQRWNSKLDPGQYRRPTAAPAPQLVAEAEKLFEQLQLAPALERRMARLSDLPPEAYLWQPPRLEPRHPARKGLFEHLLTPPAPKPVNLPTVTLTWVKFRDTVLPQAQRLELYTPLTGSYYGLTTAVNPDAPPLLQWDGLDGQPRNPVAHYFYREPSPAYQWNLKGQTWVEVKAILKSEHRWHSAATGFTHLSDHAYLVLEGCRETQRGGLGLFPENLRQAVKPVERVLEAYAARATVAGLAEGDASGIAVAAGRQYKEPFLLRVQTDAGWASYSLDRWD